MLIRGNDRFFFTKIKHFAQEENIEDGTKTRTDATAVECNIHHPTDWNLLYDCIRVLTRLMTYLVEDHEITIEFCNHFRAAKSRLFEINNSRGIKKQKKIKDIIKLTQNTLHYARGAVQSLDDWTYTGNNTAAYESLKSELTSILPQAEKILDVAKRRNIEGEEVPSSEKIVSLFEAHTDIITKGTRDSIFGHKVTITTGASGLLLDVIVHDGNPADSTIVKDVCARHIDFFHTAPEIMTFDGCYYSHENKQHLLDNGVVTEFFSKEPKKQCSHSPKVRKSCYRFRAGIEASISMLKRMFGFSRVFDKGIDSFKKAIMGGAIACNLFILARKRLPSA